MSQQSSPSDPDAGPVQADATFVIIPTWVGDADISDKAYRLYGVLRGIADNRSGYGWASRKTLAQRLHVKDLGVVDRAMDDLDRIGAVTVVPRWSTPEPGKDRHRLANGYRLHSLPRGGSRSETTTPPGHAQEGGVAAENIGGWPLQSREGSRSKRSAELDPLNYIHRTKTPLPPAGGFDEFWAAYPRKTAKDAARRAYTKALKRDSHDAIIAGLARHRWPADPQYIPYPATWLNEGRWQDEAPAPTPPQPSQAAPVKYYTSEMIKAEREQLAEETFRRIAELDAAAEAEAHR